MAVYEGRKREDMSEKKAKKRKTDEMPDVRVGDVWRDNDPRCALRDLEVVKVTREKVTAKTDRGRMTTLKRARFRPTSTGYRLVKRDGKAVA